MSDLAENIIKCFERGGSMDEIRKKVDVTKDKGKKKVKKAVADKNKKVK